jgi:superoxide dismutase
VSELGRAEYLEAWWNVVRRDAVQQRFESAGSEIPRSLEIG